MNFFRSKLFIAIAVIAVLLLVLMAYSASNKEKTDFLSNIGGILFSPVQRIATAVTNVSNDYVARFTEFNRLKEENEKLKAQIAQMTKQLNDFDRYKSENDTLRQILGLKEQRPDFQFVMAQIVSRDPGNWFETFTIDQGTLSGIKARNPVVTVDGLVGYVSEVGTTWAKITPIIDVESVVGGIVTRTREAAVVEGDLELTKEGKCKLSYLSKDTAALTGDRIETSGLGGMFPKGLLVGSIVDVQLETHGITKYAVVQPAVNFDKMRDVFVITSFTPEERGS